MGFVKRLLIVVGLVVTWFLIVTTVLVLLINVAP